MSSLQLAVHVPAFIPSPSQGVWHLGPVPLRAYALCILLGIFVGYLLGKRRWVARGGKAEVAGDMVMWAVPFGLVGSRIYHVVTDYQLYFGEGKDPVDALRIWNGGLGIWGGVAFGALGAYIACRRHGVPFLAMADAFAPGIALAQAIGRWGNYFNQELFGGPTTKPWALEIDVAHRPEGYAQFATFHPTFLYECLWNLGVVALVILVDRRFKLGHGRAFALYVAGYTLGRGWIEYMRIDTVNHVAGLRLNVWTSIILFTAAVVFFVISLRTRPGQEQLAPADVGTPAAAEADSEAKSEADPAEAPADDEPAAAADDVPAPGGDDVPAAASDDLPVEDEVPPAEAGHDVPAAVGDEVPAEASDDISAEVGREVKAEAGGDVPAAVGDEVPAEAGRDVPAAVGDEVPAEASDDTSAEVGDEVKAEARGDVPAAVGDDVPAAAGDDVPVADEDEEPADGDVKAAGSAPADGARG
jgi:prolipoprotein diacylglyceryl transferase